MKLTNTTFSRTQDIKEIEKTALNLLHVENGDIKQKHDPARCSKKGVTFLTIIIGNSFFRLPIQKCDVVIVNAHSVGIKSEILESLSYNVKLLIDLPALSLLVA